MRSCAGCSLASSRNGRICRSSRWRHTGLITRSTGSVTAWLPGCRPIADATIQAVIEAEWLPRLTPHLSLAVPVQLAIGYPAEGYPFDWSVYEWLPGENANGTIHDLLRAAVDLAAFITALRQVDRVAPITAKDGG